MSKHAYLSTGTVTRRGSRTDDSSSQLQEPVVVLQGIMKPMKALIPPRYATGCYSTRFSPDGEALAGGFGNGAVLLYEKDAEGLYTTRSTLRKGSRYADDSIMAVRFHPMDSRCLYSGGIMGSIFKHDLDGDIAAKCEKFCDEQNNRIHALDLNMNGDLLASGGKDLTIRVYDTKTHQVMIAYSGFSQSTPQADVGGHALSVFCIKFHPDQRGMLLSGGWDDVIKIWDVRTEVGVVGSLGGPHICGEAIDIKGDTVVTGSWKANQAIQLWDLRERRPIKSLGTALDSNTQGDYIYSVQFARVDPDGNHLVTAGSGTSSFQFINHRTGNVLGTGTTDKPFFTVDSFGRTLAAAGRDSWIRPMYVPQHHRS